MKNKQSALIQTSKMPLTMGLAFVAFTTQFGGGFASGHRFTNTLLIMDFGVYCFH